MNNNTTQGPNKQQHRQIMWQPSIDKINQSHMQKFIYLLGHKDVRVSVTEIKDGRQKPIDNYKELYDYSIDDIEGFWSHIWDYTNIIGQKGNAPFYSYDERDPKSRFIDAVFFPKAQLNYAENLLAGLDHFGDDDHVMLEKIEQHETHYWTKKQILNAVGSVQKWLLEQGFEKGDVTAAIAPNTAATLISMLAVTSLGGVWSSCSPDFGVSAILDRFEQIKPKILFASGHYRYNNKLFDRTDIISKVLDALSSIKACCLLNNDKDAAEADGEGHEQSLFAQHQKNTAMMRMDMLLKRGNEENITISNIEFTQCSFDDPLFIMFSSGTTGKPKSIIHGVGGTLLQHKKEHQLHADMHAGERVFYFTTCGWMMWNWLVSAMASGCVLCLYDGQPFLDQGHTLLKWINDEEITFWGGSAKYIDALRNADYKPVDYYDFKALRCLASTGSPLVAEAFDYIYDAIKQDVHVASISGGTDIISCFVGGNPIAPVYRGEIQAPGLGMAVEVWDEDGCRVKGDNGELVCTKPFPSKPIGFLHDPDQTRYLSSYFNKFGSKTWCHGDFMIECAVFDEHHGQKHDFGYIILGRSDATLNPGGVRIGTAEIYRIVDDMQEIKESIVVGRPYHGDVQIVLCICVNESHDHIIDPSRVHKLHSEYAQKIRSNIRSKASPRHVPHHIFVVSDIPRTKSGKITELAVRDILSGRDVKNTGALANPQSLDEYHDLYALLG